MDPEFWPPFFVLRLAKALDSPGGAESRANPELSSVALQTIVPNFCDRIA